MFGTIIVVLILALLAGLAARSLWHSHKSGGCCGDCSHCGGACHAAQTAPTEKR
jgi:uncharacterized membrane protein YeaQ/YmgE (transglycosylase-associated protein family)